ncbi:MAG: hypothetical protein HQK51_20475, partial [Oligoflexia bacterium]|nr:hypothetical protein [Oligoflexia bacterium]
PPDGLWKESALFNNDTKLEALTELRADLYCKLGVRKNASMDLIDALACQENAQSVTDLSSQEQFIRQYPSVRDAIHFSSQSISSIKNTMVEWGLKSLPSIQFEEKSYILLAVDSTPTPHANADCLSDRTVIHDSSNGVTGKPINIGHVYSSVVGLTYDPAWVSPLHHDRVPSTETATQFGMKQMMKTCLELETRAIMLMDSGYNNSSCREVV